MALLTTHSTIRPRPGKFDQVKDLYLALAKKVHANEKGCMKYLVLPQTAASPANSPEIYLLEELRLPTLFAISFVNRSIPQSSFIGFFATAKLWFTQGDLDRHYETSHYKSVQSILEEGDLLVQPEELTVVELSWGFRGKWKEDEYRSGWIEGDGQRIMMDEDSFHNAKASTEKLANGHGIANGASTNGFGHGAYNSLAEGTKV